jgi:signal transduction histidine kinase
LVLALISGVAIMFMLGTFIFIFLLKFQKRNSKHLLEKKRLQDEAERQIVESTLEIQHQTISHLSRELHDNVGQLLTLASITNEGIEPSEIKETEIKIKQVGEIINTAILEIRQLSRSLNPERIEKIGIADAIEEELSKINRTGKYQTSFSYEAYPDMLDNRQTLVLFRIVQEMLQNILKHAGANYIEINLKEDSNHFILEIIDNGIGITENATINGTGLINAQNRAKSINGMLSISNHSPQGVIVTITINKNV